MGVLKTSSAPAARFIPNSSRKGAKDAKLAKGREEGEKRVGESIYADAVIRSCTISLMIEGEGIFKKS